MNRHLNLLFFLLLFLLVTSPSSAKTLGPYRGEVIDSMTGEPIIGASVLIYWTMNGISPAGSGEAFLASSSAYTDSNGRFLVPNVSVKMELFTFVGTTYIIIYQPGYVTYRAEKIFKVKDNQIKLDRIPPYFDHVSHYKKIIDQLFYIDEYNVPELRELRRRVEWENRRDPEMEER